MTSHTLPLSDQREIKGADREETGGLRGETWTLVDIISQTLSRYISLIQCPCCCSKVLPPFHFLVTGIGSFQALETYIICKLVLFSVCQADWWEPSYRFLLSTYDYMEQVGALQATFQLQQLITHLWLTALGVPMRLRITAVSQHPNINRVFPFRWHLQLSLKLLENTGFLAICLERVW